MSIDDPSLEPGENAPLVLQQGPYVVQVEAGVDYRWCSCGMTNTEPWCDDSHVGTDFEPIEFTAPISGEYHMCGCKESENAPYCFGTCRGHTVENSKSNLF